MPIKVRHRLHHPDTQLYFELDLSQTVRPNDSVWCTCWLNHLYFETTKWWHLSNTKGFTYLILPVSFHEVFGPKLRTGSIFFGGHKFFLWTIRIPVLDCWWHLPYILKPGSPLLNGFLGFTSGATSVDLLIASTAVKPFWSSYFFEHWSELIFSLHFLINNPGLWFTNILVTKQRW